MITKIAFIFILGLSILIVAILLNFIATKLGISTWYDFVKHPKDTNAISFIWLFFIYPLCLGIVAYVVSKLTDI